MSAQRREALVIGAGIGGLTSAIALERAGFDVQVFEQAEHLRPQGSALSVMANAMAAFARIGIASEVAAVGAVLRTFTIKSPAGRPIASLPIHSVGERLGAPSINVTRERLHGALLGALDRGAVHTGKKLLRYVEDGSGVTAHFADGTCARGALLIGADGMQSRVRTQLLGETPIRPVNYLAWLAVTPFVHPARRPGDVSHYWGRGKRFGLIDVGHGEVYWWGTCNHPDPARAVQEKSRAEVRECFAGWAPEVQAAIEATSEQAVLKVHTRDRAPTRRWGAGRVTLLGDAAHPMLTSLGQGAAQAIEDAVVLAASLGVQADTVAALRSYERHRIDRANQVVRLARFMSGIEQLQDRFACALRNAYFRWVPATVVERQNADILRFQEFA